MFKNKTKWILSAVFACLLFVTPASAEYFSDVILTGTEGIWVDSRSYDSLQHAITAVGAADREIVIIGAQAAVALTIPANVRLRFLCDGSINNTGQLNVNTRNIIAEDRQIFTGAGDIDFVDGSVVRSSWFSNMVEALDVTFDDSLTMIVSEIGRITTNSAVGNDVTLKWESSDNYIIAYGGRLLSNVKNIEAGNYQIFAGGGDIDFLDGTELYLNWFRRLRSVLAWVEAEEVTIIVSEDSTVEYTQASTANENIRVLPGGRLTIPGGVTFTLLSPIEAGHGQVFYGDGTSVYNSPTYPNLSWFSSLSSAITAIGAFETRLTIDIDDVMAGDVTVPDTLLLKHVKGNTITTTGRALAINGPFECGLYQAFLGTGTVTFGGGDDAVVTEVYPEWWGAVNDGTTDSSVAILAAIAASEAGRIRLKFSSGRYRIVDSVLTMGDYAYWEGAGKRYTILLLEGDTSQIQMGDNATLIDMTLRGDAIALDGMIGINCEDAAVFSVSRVRVDSFDVGIEFDTTTSCTFNDCEVRSNLTYGYGYAAGGNKMISIIGGLISYNPTGALIHVSRMKFLGVTIQGNADYGIRATLAASGVGIDTCHIESNGTGGEISFENGGDGLTIVNNTIDMEDINGICINLAGAHGSVVIQGNRFTGGDADDVAIILGANIASPILMKNVYDQVYATDVTDNTITGYASMLDDDRSMVAPFRVYPSNFSIFVNNDTTPSVGEGTNGTTFFTFADNTVTITRLDNGDLGQEVTIISKGPATFDTSPATRLVGSSVDIVTASGDVTKWVCEVGGIALSVWRLISFVDVTDDNS